MSALRHEPASGCHRLAKKKVTFASRGSPPRWRPVGAGQIFLGGLGAAPDNSGAQVTALWVGVARLEAVWLFYLQAMFSQSTPRRVF